ncbi:DNA mismatch repair protein MutS [Acidipila rosea]|uniref:DNA mismatch repair protein MutS n=1 Tax=Acidipila rosea TaxID=768535 RepID=A0A4R1KXP7_9BACT|nr:DNA mismatch repair protein MutS [Acidipila rosea]TCK70168.1 DNA mismatch repair protein MutS [Acidipila rosea]
MTPLMRQYTAAKSQNPDALLFFRLGDFYELFFDDAKTAARELQITLTSRDREKSVPMCGVPYHAAEGYIARLLRKGYRVAICEQLEDPKLTKKIVRREVTRVLSPGTALDPALDSGQNNFLAALFATDTAVALALLDLSTGDFRASEFTGATALAQAIDELLKTGASELLLPAGWPHGEQVERIRTRTLLDNWVFTRDHALPLLERQLGALSLDGFGLEQHPAAAIAAGAVLHYVRTTQQADPDHIDSIRFYERTEHLQLDQVTVRNLELLEPIFSGSDADATLFRALDCCQTPMGKRLLRGSILRPLIDAAAIESRYEAVDCLRGDLVLREELRRPLAGVQDLERLLARLSLDSAGPRDVLALASSLRPLPAVREALKRCEAPLLAFSLERLDAMEDLRARIESALQTEPPLTLAEGGVIASGIDAELDELRSISSTGRQSIAAIEERERTRTGIQSLKVRFNSVFGYYLEITRANLAHVPADYERKQTLANAERFTTPELKDYETKVLTAHERAIEIEKRLFAELRRSILEHAGRIRRTSTAVAEIDLLANFAHLAALRSYTRPTIDETCVLEVAAGRHAVIECLMESAGEGRFVPNDLYLDNAGPNLLLITGPNMGGKSTYLRQAAIFVILAQMGCFVPAERMRYGIVDRVYTRIGASDNVARGRSTFMVEMTETATILNTATARSLVLLDEMGRGTATFDGLSLAWATIEYLHAKIGARTLFATHYHELTMLAEQLPRLENLRVAIKETPRGIVFLHSIERGPANKSYGIEVARLAGLPSQVIERARQVLKQHERSERRNIAAETAAPVQLTIFTPLSQRVLDRLEETDVNTLTPLQALNLIEQLKNEIRQSRGGNG